MHIAVILYSKTVSFVNHDIKRTEVNEMKKQRKAKRKKFDSMRIICWFVTPAVMAAFLTADALGIYPFTKESLTVIGICLAVALLPFFSEITVKDLSVKRNRHRSDKNNNT